MEEDVNMMRILNRLKTLAKGKLSKYSYVISMVSKNEHLRELAEPLENILREFEQPDEVGIRPELRQDLNGILMGVN